MSAAVLLAVQAGKPDPSLVAPGLGAFLAFFALAVVCVILGFSMTRRVRRSEQRQALRDQAEAEQQQAAANQDGHASTQDPAVQSSSQAPETETSPQRPDAQSQAGAEEPATQDGPQSSERSS